MQFTPPQGINIASYIGVLEPGGITATSSTLSLFDGPSARIAFIGLTGGTT